MIASLLLIPLVFGFNRLFNICQGKYEVITSALFLISDKLICLSHTKDQLIYMEMIGSRTLLISIQLLSHNAYYINDLLTNNESLSKQVHHIIAIIGSSMDLFRRNGSIVTQVLTYNAMSTSTFFLDLYRLTAKTKQSMQIQATTFLIFTYTFIYYRIYQMWFVIQEFAKTGGSQSILLLFYLIYLLNWYWLLVIFKKTIKVFKKLQT